MSEPNDVMSDKKTIEARITDVEPIEAIVHRNVKIEPGILGKLTLDEKSRIVLCLKELRGRVPAGGLHGPAFLTINDRDREVYVVVPYHLDGDTKAVTAIIDQVTSLFEVVAKGVLS